MLLTAAMIVRDEAEHLDACLASIRGLVDEIVIVDTGSADGTMEVARSHGAVVDEVPWQNDFATPRNRSLELATGEWILYIDADERVAAGDHDGVRALLGAATDHVAYRVRFVPRVGWTPYREFRVWRRRPDIRFQSAIHETVVPSIDRVSRAEQLHIGVLDALTIEHLGYEGDQHHKHERNEPMLRASLAADPDRPFLYDHLARIYEDLGEHDKARDRWRDGIAIARSRPVEHPDDRLLWINLIMHELVHDDPDGDLDALLDEARARWSGNPGIEFALAMREVASGDGRSAAPRLERLLAMDLDEVVATGTSFDGRMFGEWAWNALGLVRLAEGDAAGAADAFRHAEAAAPDDPAYRTRRQLAEARARGS